MALDEGMRHRLHRRFEELLGTDEAAALMIALPVEDRLDARFDRIEEQIAALEDRLTLRIELAAERARAETSREARFALLASFGVVAAAASAVLSAIGFFS